MLTLYDVLFNSFEKFIIVYIAAVNVTYFVLMVLGYFALRRHSHGLTELEARALSKSSLLPSISIIAPAHNESATIVQSVRSMLSLNYPDLEIVVINDGSKDN